MTGLIVNKIFVNKAQTVQLTERPQENAFMSNLRLKANQTKLLVSSFISDARNNIDNIDVPTLPAISKIDTNLIRVEPEIGEARLKQLADVCQRSEKSVFLKLPHANELPQKNQAIAWSVKRVIDWLAALVILFVLSPVMLVLAVTISSTSSGSIFFHQWRVGESGRLFRIIKFRTMITDADKLHHLVMTGQTGLHKCEDDPRITSVGRWMRKYSLDELPQLFNVLLGDMSLVGPRPWALYDALRINGDGKRRLNSLPGVTGAWQVSARSTMLDLDEVTECDLSYLRNWTLWSDLKILLMTVPKVLSGFGAC